MATQTFYFSGKAYWARVYEHNLDEYLGVKKAVIELELDPEQRALLKKSGSKVRLDLKDDGTIRAKFKRNFVNEKIPELGGLPSVFDADGKPFSDLIGNGSDVTIKVSVYDTQMGKGTRLDAVRVDTLVPYDGPSTGTSESSSADTSFLVGVPF